MYSRHYPWIAACLVLLAAAAMSTAEIDPELTAAEQTLKDAKVAADGPALLAFFRQRTLPPADRKKLDALIRQLGDEDFEVRRKAARQLRAAGKAAVSLLKGAASDEDPEIARQARECLQAIEHGSETTLVAAAARVLATRKPKGAAEVLLAYLTTVDDMADEALEEAVLDALAGVGVGGGKADPALVKALTAKGAAQRAAAAFVLGKGAPGQRPAVRRLLADPVLRVRFRAAAALFAAGDKMAVPALIDLLGSGLKDKDKEFAFRSEDLLCQLLGDQPPPAALAEDEAGRKKCVRDWKKWWKDNETKVDLVKLNKAPPELGLTVVAEYSGAGKNGSGKIWAFGRNGKSRWEIDTNLLGPTDFQLLPNGRLLVAEWQGQRVTERDLKNNILWEYKLNSCAVSCQRLPNGNIFIATQSELLEVTRKKEKVFSVAKPFNIFCAEKLRNGHVVYVHSNGHLIELDVKTGKELKDFNVGGLTSWGGLQVLPNGNFLVAQYSGNLVIEVNRKGKTVWQCQYPSPAIAQRLRNGKTLVCSIGANKMAEFNKAGKEVWTRQLQFQLFRVRRY